MTADAVMDGLAADYPAYRAIAVAEPQTFARMRAAVESDLTHGASKEQIVRRMRTEIAEVYSRRLRTAPDALLIEYWRFVVDALDYMRQHNVSDCAASMTGGPPRGGAYGPALNKRDSDILARVVTTPPADQSFASQDEAADASGEAAAAAASDLHIPIETFLNRLGGKASAEQTCNAGVAYFRQLVRRGEARPAILRTVFLR